MPSLKIEIEKLLQNPNDQKLSDSINKMLLKKFIFPQDVTSIYNIFTLPYNDALKYTAFLSLRVIDYQHHNLTKLSESLSCCKTTANEILSNKILKLTVPVIQHEEEKKAYLANAVLVELTKENCFFQTEKKDLFSVVSRLADKKFCLFFDRPICDNSYMLPILTKLIFSSDEIDKRYLFSGAISLDGFVEECSERASKEELALMHGKLLVTGPISIEHLKLWLGDEIIPVPLAILYNTAVRQGKMKIINSIETTISKRYHYFSFNNLKTFTGLDVNDLIVFDDKPIPFDKKIWENILKNKIKPLINKVLGKTSSEKTILQVFGSLAAMMTGAGIVLRDYVPFEVYHFSAGKYYPVISTIGTPRKLKKVKKIEDFSKISFKIDALRPEMNVNIFLASHDPYNTSSEYLLNKGIETGSLAIFSQKEQGYLSIDENWSEYVNEIYNLLNHFYKKNGISKYHIFISSPIAVAFALGICFGPYWDCIVYQYDLEKNSYFEAFSNKELWR